MYLKHFFLTSRLVTLSYQYVLILFFILLTAFLQQPTELLFTLDSGMNASFECRADGFPLPSIVWHKNGAVIVSDLGDKFNIRMMTLQGGLRPSVSETIVSVLTVTNLTASDAGDYSCRAVNPISSATLPTPYTLTVLPPPPPNFCSPNPCQNGGQCTSGLTTFQCTCQGNFNGTTCDTGMCMLNNAYSARFRAKNMTRRAIHYRAQTRDVKASRV